MPKDILVRNLPDPLATWIHENIPSGASQNEFLVKLIAQAAELDSPPDLFSNAAKPAPVYSALPFSFIDLFAGIGGFRIGMTAVGGDCLFSSEWDKYAARTYQSWFGDYEIHTNDIRLVDPSDGIPDHDVLCAGFPCQPFSLAGVSKKNSLGRVHGFNCEKQGNLFWF